MRIERVHIREFRNHQSTDLECSAGVNAFFGNNGEGKTNLIEAIAYLCLTKSFYAGSDGDVLRIGSDRFEAAGQLVADNGQTWSVKVDFDRLTGKKNFTINKKPAETLASVIGQFPVVVLSPEQNGITFGPPSERRRFLDIVIAQASTLYLEELLEYRKILRQRNKLLLDAKLSHREDQNNREPWDKRLIEVGSSLMGRRQAFLREYLPYVYDAYARLIEVNERPDIVYVPSFEASPDADGETLEQAFAAELGRRSDEERRTATTAIGPHRDELQFTINGLRLRAFASQGQHKTFLVALKLAEFFYLKELCREAPILVLDDVLSELDDDRSQRLLEMVQRLGQVFITATDGRAFAKEFNWSGKNRKRSVRGGIVSETEVGEYVH